MSTALSIKTKLVLLSSVALFTTVCVVALVSLWQFTVGTTAISTASGVMISGAVENVLKGKAHQQATEVQKIFTNGVSYSEALAEFASTIVQRSASNQMDMTVARSTLNEVLGRGLSKNAALLGTWAVLEPDVFGPDASFLGNVSLGANERGRFASYWNKFSGSVEDSPLSESLLKDSTIGPTGTPANYYVTCPRETLKVCISEPYMGEFAGKALLLTTISVPVLAGEKYVGAVGIDIPLDTLQRFAQDAIKDVYGGNGSMVISSSRGVIAADTRLVGKVGSVDSALIVTPSFVTANEIQRDGTDIIASVPVVMGNDLTPWRVSFYLPSDVINADAQRLSVISEEHRSAVLWKVTAIATLAVLLSAIIMWLAGTMLIEPIRRVAERLHEIASGDGDLTLRVVYARNDELGRLVVGFNSLLDKLQPIIKQIQDTIYETRDTANESLASASATNAGMQEQFREIDQLATASNEMSSTAQEVANNAAGAACAAQEVDRAAASGLSALQDSETEIALLAAQLQDAMGDVALLSQNSEQIETVLEVIRNIAQQTNLLALNAAIEAARAGESGRGFAVVADEVRTLASRTQDSVEQIRGVIEQLQSATLRVVQAMKNGQERAAVNTSDFAETAKVFQSIGRSMSLITERNLQIATAAEEQSVVAEEVSRNVANIRSVTEALSQKAEAAASISQRLDMLAAEQQATAGQFKT